MGFDLAQDQRRLEALRAYNILDTPPEVAFDRIVGLACATLEMPMAIISFVDHDRQWFKASLGIPICENSRELSFCTYTILQDEVFVVPDTLTDPCFAENPLFTREFGVRFYAGAPLRTVEGEVIGTLCIMDHRPRQLDQGRRNILRDLASLVIDELSLRIQHQRLQELQVSVETRIQERTAELSKVNSALRSEILHRKRANGERLRSEQRFHQLFNQASDAAFVHDVNGRVIDVNEVACASLGYSRAELLTMGVPDIEVTHVPAEGFRFWRELEAGSIEKFEGIHRRRDGSTFPVEIHVSVLDMAEGRHLLALIRDISERKRSEGLLRRRMREQEAVARLGTKALSGGDVEKLLCETVAVVGENLGIDMCRVYEHLPEQGAFVVRASLQAGDPAIGKIVSDDHVSSLAGHVLRTKQPVIIEDLSAETRFVIPASLHVLGLESALCVLIGGANDGDLSYGLLGVGHRQQRVFTEEDVFFVRSVANVLATAIERHQSEDKLREVEARYRRIATISSGMVFQLVMKPDGSTTIPFVSEGCRQVYGIEPAELQAEPRLVHWLVHPQDKEDYKQTLRWTVKTQEPFHWEGRVLHHSGAIRWVTARARLDPQADGNVIWDGVVLDVTDLKLAQEALHDAKEEAERAKAEAERANTAKSRFLSRMSHELRTPLNAILGFGQLLEISPANEEDKRAVEHILRGGRHLLSLVDEVLDLARVEAGELALNLVTISFGQLMQECIGFVAKMAQARSVICTAKTGPACEVPLWADEQRLRQVLLNLLSNAIKYNREGGKVTLSCQQMQTGHVRCSVEDTGLGISSEDLLRLFVPFERLGQEFSDTEGTELGLVVSRRLAEAMNGTVGAESWPNVGSTFWVEVPAAEAMQIKSNHGLTAAPIPEPETTFPFAATVLYVEDNPSNLEVMQSVVLRLRPTWRFLSALDGVSGLRLAREQRPDVVLLDLEMPGMKGDSVLSALRAEASTAHLPVLLLTADAMAQSRERLLGLGANGYFTKPFNVVELLEQIEVLLLAYRAKNYD